MPNVNNGLPQAIKKAVNLAVRMVASANIVGKGRGVNSDPNKMQ